MDSKKFGKTIYLLRVRHNMTQEDLAFYLSVSRETISKWERGIYIPSIEYLLLLSEIFNISLDDMLKCVRA